MQVLRPPSIYRIRTSLRGVWLCGSISPSGVSGGCKLYDPVILVLATVRFHMSKTEFNHFVYIYSVYPWQPASNLQRAEAIKWYSFIMGKRLDITVETFFRLPETLNDRNRIPRVKSMMLLDFLVLSCLDGRGWLTIDQSPATAQLLCGASIQTQDRCLPVWGVDHS